MSQTGERLYADDMQAFLKMFAKRTLLAETASHQDRINQEAIDIDEVKRELCNITKTHFQSPQEHSDYQGALHPISITKELIQKLLPNANQEVLFEILDATFTKDPLTDYYQKHCMPYIVGLAHMQAQETNIPICLVEGDLTNAGGGNDVVGFENNDKFIRAMCRIAKEKLGKEAVQVIPVRKGGDELQMVVYGLEKKEVDSILVEVHDEINLLSAQCGLHNVPHTKKNKLPGVGAAFASVDLREPMSLAKIQETLEAGIEDQKAADSLLRFGMINSEGVDRYIQKYLMPSFSKRDAQPTLTHNPDYAEHLVDTSRDYLMLTDRSNEKQVNLYLDEVLAPFIESRDPPSKDFEAFIDQTRKDLARYGIANEEGVEHYIHSVLTPIIAAKEPSPLVIAEVLDEGRDFLNIISKELNTRWENALKHNQAYIESGVTPTENPVDYFRKSADGPTVEVLSPDKEESRTITAFLNALPGSANLDAPVLSGKIRVPFVEESPDSILLRESLQRSEFSHLASIDAPLVQFEHGQYVVNREAISDALKENNPARNRELRLLIELTNMYNSRDPSSRLKTSAHLEEHEIIFARQHDDTPPRKVYFQVENISGMNNLNSNLADAVLRKSAQIIQTNFEENAEGSKTIGDYMYHLGGGRFAVFLPQDYPDATLEKVSNKIIADVGEQIVNKSIHDFALATYANPSHGREEASKAHIAAIQNKINIETTIGNVKHPKDKSRLHIHREETEPAISNDDYLQTASSFLSRLHSKAVGGKHHGL